jgi:hypothetical protein
LYKPPGIVHGNTSQMQKERVCTLHMPETKTGCYVRAYASIGGEASPPDAMANRRCNASGDDSAAPSSQRLSLTWPTMTNQSYVAAVRTIDEQLLIQDEAGRFR